MDIFPVGWAEKNGHKLYPPKGYVQSNFSWNAYLKSTKAVAASKTFFQNRSVSCTGSTVYLHFKTIYICEH